MPRIFRKGRDGLLAELPHGYDYSGQMHSRELMLEAIVLLNDAEIAELEERGRQAEQELQQQQAKEAAAAERRAAAEAKLAALGLTSEDIEVLRA